MRSALAFLVLMSACTIGTDEPGGGGGTESPDAAMPSTPDAPATATCPLPDTIADTGQLPAIKAQRCNVPNTQGTRKWYRVLAALPGAPDDIVQIELWDGQGAFTGGTVRTGAFPLAGAELDYETCGVCVRAVGNKGSAGAKLYMATGGTVEVTSVGAGGSTITARLVGGTFTEITSANERVTGGCATALAGTTLTGTLVDTGGGGAGGGGGGGSNPACPLTVGD